MSEARGETVIHLPSKFGKLWQVECRERAGFNNLVLTVWNSQIPKKQELYFLYQPNNEM